MPGPTKSIDLGAPIGRWTYSSAAPVAALGEHIVEYWEVQGELAPFRERILPNACAELMFNLGPSHRMIAGPVTSVWEQAWFSGLHERAITIESDDGTHLVSVRFAPMGMHALLGIAPHKTTNQVVDAAALLGGAIRELHAALCTARGPAERFALLEAFLLTSRDHQASTSTTPPIEPYVRAAAGHIAAAHGNLAIATLHRAVGVSRKQLTMRFTAAMGISPKRYANLQRFVWTVAQLRERTDVDWTRLALQAGFADQSHMVRDFRRVANASPTHFLRQRSPDNTALLEAQPEAEAR